MKTILYGLRASGKTTILQELQEKTGISGLDLDTRVVQEIQKSHRRVQSITDFVEWVWSMAQFRDLEHNVLKEVLNDNSPMILALGWGTVAYDRNRHVIDPVDNYMMNPHSDEDARKNILEKVFNREKHPKKSIRVFLDISPEEQRRRLEKDDEGNKDRPDLGKSLQGIYDERIQAYRDFANFTISVDGKTIEEIVDEILWNKQIEEAIKRAA